MSDGNDTIVPMMIVCPRCNKADETVLLDQEGEPYMCDECWDEMA